MLLTRWVMLHIRHMSNTYIYMYNLWSQHKKGNLSLLTLLTRLVRYCNWGEFPLPIMSYLHTVECVAHVRPCGVLSTYTMYMYSHTMYLSQVITIYTSLVELIYYCYTFTRDNHIHITSRTDLLLLYVYKW